MSASTVADARPAPSPSEDPTPSVAATTTASKRERRRRRRQARTGARTVDRANRVLLALLGLVAIALGTVALLAGDGDRIDLRQPRSLYADARASAIDFPAVWAPAAVAGGLVVAALGLIWAWVQIRPRAERGRLGTTVVARSARGQTTLEPAPVARVLAADVRQIDGVVDASARLVALGRVPEMLLSVETMADAHLPTVRQAIEAPLARMAASLDTDAVDAELRIRIGRDEGSRVL